MDPSPKRHSDLHSAELIEIALAKNEGFLAHNGALCVETGERTGRSPNDCFIVDECSTNDLINWGEANRPFSKEGFDQLWAKVEDNTLQNDHYVSHLEVGDHPDFYIPIEVTTQTAWHSLFARNIFVCPEQFNVKGKKKWRVLHAPHFTCEPETDKTHSEAVVIIHFAKRKVLIAGMQYGGELKKALFTVQNFLLLEKDVLPMQCSANVGEAGDVSLFFGLSGTGKTTLSSNEDRFIVGDDEHGWAKGSVFNLEGGCYAKTFSLTQDQEPVIWDAIGFGAILENVVHNTYTREPDFTAPLLGENGRCCYPLRHVEKRKNPSRACEPSSLIFLSCDVLGVLPAVSKLSPQAAAYHFLSGYTAKVGSTEIGSDDSFKPVFSACFSSPFLPRSASEYATLLLKRIEEFKCDIFLVNTGWSGGYGGPNGSGKPLPIEFTRNIIHCIQNGALKNIEYQKIQALNLNIPQSISHPNIDNSLLNPRNNWKNKEHYDKQALQLAQLFVNNMSKYTVNDDILKAGPIV